MTVEQLLAYLPSDFYVALGQLWPSAAAGLVMGVTPWLVASVVRFGFDLLRG